MAMTLSGAPKRAAKPAMGLAASPNSKALAMPPTKADMKASESARCAWPFLAMG